jgi:hypothetical protein
MTLYDEDILDILDQAFEIRIHGFKSGIKQYNKIKNKFPRHDAYNLDPALIHDAINIYYDYGIL